MIVQFILADFVIYKVLIKFYFNIKTIFWIRKMFIKLYNMINTSEL